jgi:histidyl-tRNA synthetase
MRALQDAAHELSRRYGYAYVETPAFEQTDLFARSAGETSDVVTKEMYTFEDKGGRSLTLRPEGTAPVVRAYLAHRQALPLPFKAYYVVPMWRHGRPQAGRLREFRQWGVEVIGTVAPEADVEVLVLGDGFLRGRGLENLRVRLNSIGDDTCRPAYREMLRSFLERHRAELCPDCRARMEQNPLRTFDCKKASCRAVTASAPLVSDHLCDACRGHFASVQEGLAREDVHFEHDPRLVRGLDYYTRTVFEIESGVLAEAQASVCSGGRYDGLAATLGGPDTPGVGFGLGLERVLLAIEGEGLVAPGEPGPDCFVVALGPDARETGRKLLRSLRRQGVSASGAFEERPLKAQLKMADRSGARFAAIVGEREASERVVTMRDLRGGAQDEVALGEVGAWVLRRA